MGNPLKILCKAIKIVQNNEGADLSTPTAWTTATDLGELKGDVSLKLTWKQKTYQTQKGKKPLGLTATFETSTVEIADTAIQTALLAMRGKNVSLQVTPKGTVSADNPIIIVKDFSLLIDGEINAGDVSFLKLNGEKEAYDETEIYERDANAGT